MNQDDLYVQRKGHHTKDCKSKRACFWCKNRHHTSICQRDSCKTQSGRVNMVRKRIPNGFN